MREGRRQLSRELTAAGCTVWPSAANFVMFRLPEGADAAACVDHLLRGGLIIRSLNSYDLPRHLRVSVGTPEENARFLALLHAFLEAGR